MKPNVLTYAGGLGLIAGALLWSSPSQAQGYCYLVNSEGEVVNLDDLCQSNSTPQPVQSQTGTSGVGEAVTETQDGTSPRVRNYTITGPAAVPGSSTTPAGSPTGQPGAANTSPEATPGTAPGAASGATTDPADVDDVNTEPRVEENRLDIPVREIEAPRIPTPQTQPPRVTSPEAQDPTVDTPTGNTTDTRSRPANGNVIRGTERIVVPSNQGTDN
ncbi:hypothetical protein IQ265_04925 [Nodosilinea sp. LEGE 06152]|uniref:hypothetical protein n=1 Tax=Nodosilinea sp. LEGE 06152 TaxID=2777966 RepID=UPI001880B3E0|nr:hypothetical protein [Nodosilinea sp. LEGE 06152]MBE9156175.1 hypothetical protein [Nodosilinea sp. LEGE 06152]